MPWKASVVIVIVVEVSGNVVIDNFIVVVIVQEMKQACVLFSCNNKTATALNNVFVSCKFVFILLLIASKIAMF